MALSVPKAPGFTQMMKDGAKHFSGLEETVIRSIDACKELANTTRSVYGPNGLNKMVINHLEKLFTTNDAATILRELEVEHPAAKLLVMATQQQESECGDGTNFVMVFAGALLSNAEELIRMGLSVTEVAAGYDMALKKAHQILEELVTDKIKDINDKEEVKKVIKTAVMSKQYGNEDFLASLIVDACIQTLPRNSHFNVDSIRVLKVLGSGLYSSSVLNGMVFKREVEGTVTKLEDVKVAVYSCPLDIMQTETKGTVLIKTAQELLDYSKGEESIVEEQIKSIAASGCKAIVTGGKVGDLTLHYCNKYELMVVRLLSKFDLRRLCKAIGAIQLPRLTAPAASELGHCDMIYVEEIGETCVVVFKQEKEESSVATIIIRGAIENIMDDIERAVDDGVNTFKALSKDSRIVAGAGAVEIELAKQITSYSETCPGLEQYAIKKYADALESIPRALAENSGFNANEVISQLYAAHQSGGKHIGVDIMAESASVLDSIDADIKDLWLMKHWGMKFAVNAANTVLKVDQIIMAKKAGGPKPKENPDYDEDD